MAQLSSTQIYGNLSVDGKTLLNGALNLADNVTIDKDLTVNGSTHLKTTSTEKLTVNGSLIANGDINANSHQVTAATFVGNLSGNATSATFLQADSRQSNPDLAIKTSGVNYCVLSGYSLTTDNATADSSVISSSDAILLSLPWDSSTTYGAQLMFDDTSEGKLWVRTKNSSWGKWARIFTTAGGKIAGATTFLEKITASKGGTFEGDVSMTKLTVNGGVTVNGDINANSHQVTAGTFVGNLTGNATSATDADTVDGWHIEYENGYASNSPAYICGFDTANKKIKATHNGLINGGLTANGASHFANTLKVDKRLTANGKISVPTTGVSWVSGMNLDNCAIGISTQNAGGAYFPVIGGKTVKGNVWNIGSIYDTFGVYGFKVGRTEDSTDWSFTWNTENGAVSSTGSITAPTLTGTDITTNNLTTTGSTTIASLRVNGEADFNNIVTVNNNLTVAEGELTVTKGNLIVSEGNISATKGTISATTFEGDLNGNASTATKADNATQAESATSATEAESLTTKAVGSKSEPIYWEGGKPVKCDPIEVVDEKVKQVLFNPNEHSSVGWRPLVISASPGGDFVGETFISGDLLANLPGGALKSKANVTNNSYINENLTLIRQSRFEQYGTGRIGCFWIG